MSIVFLSRLGVFSDDQLDKWSIITHDRLLSLGFEYMESGVVSGKSEYRLEKYKIPNIDDVDGYRFIFDGNTSYIHDFKLNLPAKHCSSLFDIKQYIAHSRYFD